MKVTGTAETTEHFGSKSILVVDDDPDVLFFVRHILEYEGMDVCCAENGHDALEILSKRVFEVMITDLNMPGLNGFELSQEAHAIAPKMAIIMCTGVPDPTILSKAAEFGIIEVLAKPLNVEKLLATLRETGI